MLIVQQRIAPQAHADRTGVRSPEPELDETVLEGDRAERTPDGMSRRRDQPADSTRSAENHSPGGVVSLPRARFTDCFRAIGRAEVSFQMLDRLCVILRAHDDGQTMAEYGVVIALITLLVFAAFTALSGEISATVDTVRAMLPG